MANWIYVLEVVTASGERFEMYAPRTVESGAWTAESMVEYVRNMAAKTANIGARLSATRSRGPYGKSHPWRKWEIDSDGIVRRTDR